MQEMWFMNNASNYLLKNIYPLLEPFVKPADFGKIAFESINSLEDFKAIKEEIADIFDPNTPPKTIRKLGGDFRVNTIEKFLSKNEIILRSDITRRCLEIL
jgi:hypothetical protein